MKTDEVLKTISEGENETVEFKASFNKASIITGKAQRTERWDYPLDALREIVVNMVVHRDYMHPGDSIVKIYDDFIEFFNPGALPEGLSVKRLLSGNYTSSIRNKQIALVFKEAGLIEKYGSGIKRIIKACNEHGIPTPSFEEFQHGFRVRISKTTQKTTQETTQKIATQDQILILLSENPSMTRDEIAKALSKSPNTIKEHLSKLKAQNRIKRIGSDRKGYWEVLKA